MPTMMKPVAKMEFTAQMTLSEAEVRVLEYLAGYESGITAAIRLHCCSNFDSDVLTNLLKRWRKETAECTERFDAARKAFTE